MFDWIKSLFAKPSALNLLVEQMEESQRLYVAHFAEMEYHKAQCAMHKDRIQRIAGQMDANSNVRHRALRLIGEQS